MINYILGVIPIPVFYGSGGGGRIETLLGCGILLNIIWILVMAVRTVIYFRNKSRLKSAWYITALKGEEYEYTGMSIFSILMIVINGLALLLWAGSKIGDLL